jgi:hypothetical protein
MARCDSFGANFNKGTMLLSPEYEVSQAGTESQDVSLVISTLHPDEAARLTSQDTPSLWSGQFGTMTDRPKSHAVGSTTRK